MNALGIQAGPLAPARPLMGSLAKLPIAGIAIVLNIQIGVWNATVATSSTNHQGQLNECRHARRALRVKSLP